MNVRPEGTDDNLDFDRSFIPKYLKTEKIMKLTKLHLKINFAWILVILIFQSMSFSIPTEECSLSHRDIKIRQRVKVIVKL